MEPTWTNITGDQVVSKVRCKLLSVVLTPSSATKYTDLSLYNGESTSDPLVLVLRTGTGVTRRLNFPVPLVLDRGLYVDVGGDLGSCLVQWVPLES